MQAKDYAERPTVRVRRVLPVKSIALLATGTALLLVACLIVLGLPDPSFFSTVFACLLAAGGTLCGVECYSGYILRSCSGYLQMSCF